MGFTKVPNDVIDDPRLGKHEILVYVALMRHADNETGRCFPGIRTIAKKARLSGATVLKAINVLVQAGWLRVKKRNEPGRKEHAVNNYIVLSRCSSSEHVYHGANTGVRPVDDRCSSGRTELDSRTRMSAEPQVAGLPSGPPPRASSTPKAAESLPEFADDPEEKVLPARERAKRLRQLREQLREGDREQVSVAR